MALEAPRMGTPQLGDGQLNEWGLPAIEWAGDAVDLVMG